MDTTSSNTQHQHQQAPLQEHRNSDGCNNAPLSSTQQHSAASSRCETPLRPMAGLLDWLPIAGNQTPTLEHSAHTSGSSADELRDKNESPEKDKTRRTKGNQNWKTTSYSQSSPPRRLSSSHHRERADMHHQRQHSLSSLVLSNDDQQQEQELNNSSSTTHFMGSMSISSKRAARSVFRSVVFDEGDAESAAVMSPPPARADNDSCEAQHHSLSSLIDIVKRPSISSSPILSQSSVVQRSIDGLGTSASKRSSGGALCSTQAVMSVSGDSTQRWGFSASTNATLGKGDDGHLSRDRTPRTLHR